MLLKSRQNAALYVFNIFICGTSSKFSRNTCQIINKLPLC